MGFGIGAVRTADWLAGGAGVGRIAGGVAAGTTGFKGGGTAFGATAGATTRGAAAGDVTTGWVGTLGLAGGGRVEDKTVPQNPQNLLPAGSSLRQFEHTVGVVVCRGAGGAVTAA